MRRQSRSNARPDLKFDGVTLAVSKTDCLHSGKSLKRPSEADGRILTSRK
jgi:hypothetical protein